jgi:beta-lactam-binding protein with PASTA domain
MKKGKTVSPVVAAIAIVVVLVIVVTLFLWASKPKGVTVQGVSQSDAAKAELKTRSMDAEVASQKARIQMEVKMKQQIRGKMGGL